MSIESRSRQYGKIFDHWQIRGKALGHGSGGKTAVFRMVRSDSSHIESALKVIGLLEEYGNFNYLTESEKQVYEETREACRRKAEQEVLLMDQLRHQNIVAYLDHTVADWEEDDRFGSDFLIRMELLTDLRSKMNTYFDESEVLKIGKDICAALVYCHGKNILHRDVKPENIFVDENGTYKLGDFGVSRVLDACSGRFAGTRVCTYEYCPPEQLTRQYDKRVDIYSLGLVLYELSNRNRLPFAATGRVTESELNQRFNGEKLPPPVDASPALAKVILKACAHDPKRRYQTAEEFLRALESIPEDMYGTVVAGPDGGGHGGDDNAPQPPHGGIIKFFVFAGIILVAVLLACLITRYLLPNLNVFEEAASETTEATVSKTVEETVPNVIEKQITSVEAGRDHTVAIEVGDMVFFGHYEQDGNQKNGPENIEWMVLDVQGNRALLLSCYALDAQPYNSDYEAVTWETSTVRKWLNSTFFKTAFTTEEQSAILLTTVDNSALQGNSRWNDQEQKNTEDNVFLLSYAESDLYFDDDEARRCIPTNYAVSMGAETKNFIYGTPDTGWWWLRSPGEKPHYAAFVNFDGERYSNAVGNEYLSVRPALWVYFDSDIFAVQNHSSEDDRNPVTEAIRERLPIVTYAMTNSDEVYSYSDPSLSRKTKWYYFNSWEDEIVITDVSDDGGALYVRYPSTTADVGYRDCWFATEDILGSINPMVYTFEAAQRVDLCRLESVGSLCRYGTIWNQPECYNLGTYKSGNRLVICPMNNEIMIYDINVIEKMGLIP